MKGIHLMEGVSKRAVITGASTGIGRFLSLELASAGVHVYGVARRGELFLSLAELRPGKITPIEADIRTRSGRDRLREELSDSQVDFLVNGVGTILPIGPVTELSEDMLRDAIETNLIGPWMLTNAVVSRMKCGRIMNISTRSAHQVFPGLSAY